MAERGVRPRWGKRGWYLLGCLAAALLLWFGAPRLGKRLAFFRIRRIEFVGLRHLEPARAVEALALTPEASIFDGVRPLEQRLFAVRGVKSVAVRRRLPGTLVVELEEWRPVALAPQGGQLALVDESGRILPFDPALAAPDLPVAPEADSVVARVLATVQVQDPSLFADVGTAWRVGGDVVLEVRGRRFWFRPDVSAEDIRAVMAVAHDLARQGRTYQELDGRFAGQVIVRWARA